MSPGIAQVDPVPVLPVVVPVPVFAVDDEVVVPPEPAEELLQLEPTRATPIDAAAMATTA